MATHLENLEKLGNSKMVREKSGKMEKVRETEIYLDFERAEELKLQLLAACGPGLWICSSLSAPEEFCLSRAIQMFAVVGVVVECSIRYVSCRWCFTVL